MSSDVVIANRALQKLGEDRVTAINPPDASKAARAIAACWDTVRDRELRAHAWSFARVLATLPADALPPPFNYSAQYQLPADCLRILVVGNMRQSLGLLNYRSGLEAMYRVYGRKIYTSLPAPLALEYTARITDTAQWDACFVEAFACKLALEVCEELTQNAEKKKLILYDYKEAISEALLANAVELPPEGLCDDSFVLARL